MKLFILSFFTVLFTLTVKAQNKTWTCIDTSGNATFTVEAKYVSDFSHGLAKIYQQNYINNAWQQGYGYINEKGEIVIPCIYYSGKDFKDGLTWVQKEKNGIYTLINDKGEIIPTKGYNQVGYIIAGSSERLAVYENEKLGFIDRAGKEVIPCKYLGSNNFDDGRVCVCPYESVSSNYGFLDMNGKNVTPFHFKQAGESSFSNGLCRVNSNGKPAMIDTSGKVVFTTKYKSLQDFNFGLAAVCTKSDRTGWGFINRKDELVIAAQFDYATSFNEDGLAIVEKGKLKGVIDTLGKLVIPMKYETVYCDVSASGFICGVYKSDLPVSLHDAKKDYYNSNFELIPFDGRIMSSANNGNRIFFMDKENKIGYKDRSYQTVIQPQFEKANFFHENKSWVIK